MTLQLDDMLRAFSPQSMGTIAFASNSLLTAELELSRFKHTPPQLVAGRIVQSLPMVHWYKVLLFDANGAMPCCAMSSTGMTPIGVRPTAPLTPGTIVLVARLTGQPTGVILGSIPSSRYDGNLARPDWLQQGGATGFKRERMHYETLRVLTDGGGVSDFNNNSPMDSTVSGEYGLTSETGIALFLDSFQAFLRVNEVCGLFLNYLDSYMRLAGWNLDLQTAAHEICVRLDEGENQYFEGCATYPWEALGSYSGQSTWTKEHSDVEVQYDQPVAKIEPTEQNLSPIYRYREYGGYLGQGRRRMVVVPRSISTGQEKFDTTSPAEHGVWEESVALDGDYLMRSAKGLAFVKSLLIPAPKQKRLPEDQKTGDKTTNYKASGFQGSGDEHNVVDQPANPNDGQSNSVRAAAALSDLLTYAGNWKGLHPFHYHKEDYELPEESELAPFQKSQEQLDYTELQDKQRLADPEPVEQSVDHRYGAVKYYQREAYIALLPDGSVMAGDGSGCEIRLVNGEVTVTSPADIRFEAGRDIHLWAGRNLIMKARKSIDASASESDVRIKAEKNMQLLSGNAGVGGCMIENRAVGTTHQYDLLKGEDVIGSGILLRAPKSQVFNWASNIYLRTGGNAGGLTLGEGAIDDGDIVLDASHGRRSIMTNSLTFTRFIGFEADDLFGTNGTIQQANRFSGESTELGSGLTVKGSISAVQGGSLMLEGSISLPNGHISSRSGGDVGKLEGISLQLALDSISRSKRVLANSVSVGNTQYEELRSSYYATGKIGNEELQVQAQFSFRDDDKQVQYGTADFTLPEARWQQMVRLDLATGGQPWKEKPVRYQGEDLYPFPGRKKLTEEACRLELKELVLYSAGKAKDRSDEAYLSPTLAEFEKKVIDEVYLVS